MLLAVSPAMNFGYELCFINTFTLPRIASNKGVDTSVKKYNLDKFTIHSQKSVETGKVSYKCDVHKLYHVKNQH